MTKQSIVGFVVFLLNCLLLPGVQHPPPLFEWAKVGSGSIYPIKAQNDRAGNTVVSGSLFGNTTIDSVTLTNTSGFPGSGFSLVFDPGGNVVSSFQTTGSGSALMIAVPLLSGGTAYLGTMSGTVTMGQFTQTDPIYQTLFFACAETNNEVETFEMFDTNADLSIVDACLTPEGNIIAFGALFSPTIQIGSTTLTNDEPYTYDLMLVKFSPAGQPIWARSYPQSGYQYALRMAQDSTGYLYICGYTETSVQVGPYVTSDDVIFVMKLDPDGEPIWTRTEHGSPSEWCYGIDVNTSGDVFLACVEYNKDYMWLSKYDPDGTLQWQFVGPTNVFNYSRCVKAGYDGEAYVGGSYNRQGAVWKIDENGQLVWMKTIGGDGTHYFEDMAVDSGGAITLFGMGRGTNIVFDGNVITNPDFQSSDSPLLVARLAPDPPALRFQQAGTDFIVSWPTNQPAFQLEANDLSFSPSGWLPVEFGAAGLRYYATNQLDQASRVFRLRKNN